MTKLKQSLVTIVGVMVLSFIFVWPMTNLYQIIFGKGGAGGGLYVIGPDIPEWIDGFLFAFPFFLTLLEFFFKKPILERRPYLYIIGFFVLISFVDEKFLLATIAVVLLGALPGSVYRWVRDRKGTS